MSSLHRIAVSDILDDFLDCPDAYSAMAHEISKLRQQLTAATTERNAALRRHAHATHCYQGESPDGCVYGAVDCLMDGAPIVAERERLRAELAQARQEAAAEKANGLVLVDAVVGHSNHIKRLAAEVGQEAKRADAMQRSCEANYAEVVALRAALARLQQEREGLIALVKERGSLIVEDHHDYSMTGNKWCSVCGNSTGAAACFIVQHDPRCVVHWLPTETQE